MPTLPTPSLPATPRANAGTVALDMAEAFEDFMTAFEAFKETNDRRLAELESQRPADPLTEEKLARINAALDSQKQVLDGFLVKSRRPGLSRGAGGRFSASALEHKGAFEAYVRHGRDAGLSRLEEKALSIGSDPDGGNLVPE